jgi:hypothetical protein
MQQLLNHTGISFFGGVYRRYKISRPHATSNHTIFIFIFILIFIFVFLFAIIIIIIMACPNARCGSPGKPFLEGTASAEPAVTEGGAFRTVQGATVIREPRVSLKIGHTLKQDSFFTGKKEVQCSAVKIWG